MRPLKATNNCCFYVLTDIHVDVKPVCDEAHPCTCKRPYDPEVKGCGEECLNRYVTLVLHISHHFMLSVVRLELYEQKTTDCIME